ncbi:MAG: DUF4842 domain-containing protein [Prevotella sp.]|nr:DUF4842 domain-containing protein [Prevotella sp.]MBQ9262119.1 DUF4842 domain-containing protein [Prevotella sp.]MBR1767650.1 DUF4842 domain-containing protein [Prevotella sp.]
MKKLFILTILGSLALSSCSDFDFDGAQAQQIKENAEEIFGIIDPNQDWRCIESGSITVTADAPLNNITKVQILTESPFFNDQAQILAEAEAKYGETVTLSFEAPRGAERLIAACINENGHYFIKGFTLGDTKVNFISSSANARSRTRSVAEYPDFSKVVMSYSNSYPSYNAARTIAANENSSVTYSQWKGKNWENDRLWEISGSLSGSWTNNAGTICKNADEITKEEKAELWDIFNSSLFRDVKNNKKRDNLELIRRGNAVRFFDNHIVSDGSNPITIIPVQLASTEAYMCDLYYYYYKPEEVPSNMSLTDYIKTLPKFKAVDFNEERGAFKAITNIAKNANDTTFMKVHEYLLPFYGDPSEFVATNTSVSSKGFKTDGKFYRIKNEEKGMYMTYTSNAAKNIMNKYDDNADNIKDQLWQIFKNNEGLMMFYNVGKQQFLKFIPNTYPAFSSTDTDFNKFCFMTADSKNNQTSATEVVHILTYNKSHCLKSRESTNIAIDGNKTDRLTIQWTFEEFVTTNIATVNDVEVEIWPASLPTPSAIIDKDYRIGFMLRKGGDKVMDDNKLKHDKNGCLYSYGEMNTEINTFGSFRSAMDKYSMKENDPRIAMFNANCKTYLTFEDGTDCNFSDIIIEIGGYSAKGLSFKSEDPTIKLASEETVMTTTSTTPSSGVYLFENIPEDRTAQMVYTMCFEDRLVSADYDLNDLVLRCKRHNTKPDMVQLSIVAIGASDNLYIEGIDGTLQDGYPDLTSKEVHEYFFVQDETGEARFVNTIQGKGSDYDPVTSWYKIDSDMTIPKFLSKIKVRNATTGQTISVPEVGLPPYALILPGKFEYPREYLGIERAYSTFQTWVQNASLYNNWMEFIESDDYVIINNFNNN